MFGPGAPVKELNSTVDDLPSWISPDGCTMYLSGGRPNGAGKLDIWVARRPK